MTHTRDETGCELLLTLVPINPIINKILTNDVQRDDIKSTISEATIHQCKQSEDTGSQRNGIPDDSQLPKV